MKKNYQIPATNVILVQPIQMIAGSGERVSTVNSGDTGITYGGAGSGNAMSRRGGWADDEE